jgi:hypothetical protein
MNNYLKFLGSFLLLALTGCASSNGTNHFDITGPEELTASTLPAGSRMNFELTDGSDVTMTIGSVDDTTIYSTRDQAVEKASVEALTVMRWGRGNAPSGNQARTSEAAALGIEVLGAFTCASAALVAGLNGGDVDCGQ